ncbi:hypothetical protein KEM56_001799 [Ascosphaera pollenicola]|nr:hypothetical protein KEM56_001799 [Ascosphaera pollenicola]
MNEPSMIGEGTSYTSTESQSQQPRDSPSIHDRLLSLASLASKLDASNQMLPEHEEKLHWKLDKVEAELHSLNRDAVPSDQTTHRFPISTTTTPLSVDHNMPLEVATLPEPPKSTRQFAEGSTASLFRQVDQEYYKAVLGDLDSLTQEFRKRHDECLQIKSAAAVRQDGFLKELSDREEKIMSL